MLQNAMTMASFGMLGRKPPMLYPLYTPYPHEMHKYSIAKLFIYPRYWPCFLKNLLRTIWHALTFHWFVIFRLKPCGICVWDNSSCARIISRRDLLSPVLNLQAILKKGISTSNILHITHLKFILIKNTGQKQKMRSKTS